MTWSASLWNLQYLESSLRVTLGLMGFGLKECGYQCVKRVRERIEVGGEDGDRALGGDGERYRVQDSGSKRLIFWHNDLSRVLEEDAILVRISLWWRGGEIN